MVHFLHLPTALTTATLLGGFALAIPFPPYVGQHANQGLGPAGYIGRGPPGYGQGGPPNVAFTRYTTFLYTTNTFTSTFTPAPVTLTTFSTASPTAGPTASTASDPSTSSLSLTSTPASSDPPSSTVSSSSSSASTTLPTSTTASPASTAFSSTSTSSIPLTSSTTVISTSTSSTLATIISLTSLTTPSEPPTSSTVSTPLTAPTSSASTCAATAAAPAPTNPGTVAGCTQWYVAQPGDYCITVAQQFGLSVETFMAWNPSVVPPTCPRMLAGDAYCVEACGPAASGAVSSGAATSVTTSASASSALSITLSSSHPPASSTTAPSSAPASPSSTASPANVYRSYNGDGTPADGWPTEADWVDFDYMFVANTPQMRESCAQWGVPNDNSAEITTMHEQILSIGQETGVDPRFILAIIMQESTGCVRVITTAYSHANPGLMQSFNGTGSCNSNAANIAVPGVPDTGVVQTPCPASEIRQQILDGTNGTVWGPGLVQDLAEQGRSDSSRWYRAARLYNGGAIVDGDLSQPCCTPSYASDVANRLTGWTTAPRTFVATR